MINSCWGNGRVVVGVMSKVMGEERDMKRDVRGEVGRKKDFWVVEIVGVGNMGWRDGGEDID